MDIIEEKNDGPGNDRQMIVDIIEEKNHDPRDDRQMIKYELLARHLAYPHVLREEIFELLKRKHATESDMDEHSKGRLQAAEYIVKTQGEHFTGVSLEEILPSTDLMEPLQIPELEWSADEPEPIGQADFEHDPVQVSVALDEHEFVNMAPDEHEFAAPAPCESAPEVIDQPPESQILRRVAQLKREGLWSDSRLPLCVEPLRNWTHWDYLLEEVIWMSEDFYRERRSKISTAKKISGKIANKLRLKAMAAERAVIKEKENELKDGKKQCAAVAKLVKDFWQNVNELILFKIDEALECKRKRELDKQLNLIVKEADKLSSMMKDGLTKRPARKRVTRSSKRENLDQEVPETDKEFDSETTWVDGANVIEDDDDEDADDIAALIAESTKELEDVFDELPLDYREFHGIPPAYPGGDGRGALKRVDYDKLDSENSVDRENALVHIAEEVLQFQPKGYTLETTQVKTPVPFLMRGTLREYQMVGLDWLVTLYEKNLNGILADEMGLGKTIQTIALLAHLAGAESIWGPHLIIVPTSVILNWEMELKKWCPALKILTYFGTVKERAEKRKGWMKPNAFHVVIGSYQTVTQDIRAFKNRRWQYMILDEAQNIKNWKSKRWQWLRNIRARRRLLLTGTPLQNSLMELWALMHFLMPSIFDSNADFKHWFDTPMRGQMDGTDENNPALVSRLHKILRPFILRRMKNEVEKQLPDKIEHVLSCQLSKRQRFLYDDFMSRRMTRDNLKTGNTLSVLNIVMQLRKCCNHPNLFEPRSVQTPLILPPIRRALPALIFDIIAPDSTELKPIPVCLDLRRHLAGYSPLSDTKVPRRRELKQILIEPTTRPPPKITGFRLSFPTKRIPTVKIVNLKEEKTRASSTISGRSLVPKRSMDLNPSFKSYTANFPSPALPIVVDGFNRVMAKSPFINGYKFTPPLRLCKKAEVVEPYSSLISENIKTKLTDAQRYRLKLAKSRFESQRPVMAQELLDSVMVRTKWAIDIRSQLHEQQHAILDKFSVVVDPAQVNSPTVSATSVGRTECARLAEAELKFAARSYLENCDPMVNDKMLSSRLQFPEMRLIEYDCGKLQTLGLLLRQLFLYKHRCLIFTQMSRMLDILQSFLSYHGYHYFRLDGSTGIEQRHQMMEQFNADPRIFCFILSTRSGGVGVNLTGADTVIFYDSDWNPTMDAQAQDRCHRIGQTKDVTIYRLISESTIEENILKKARQKRRLGELAIDEAGFTPAFFTQTDNIRDLFEGQTADLEIGQAERADLMNQKQLETVMASLEDEQDADAMKKAAAETGFDSAEFVDANLEKTTMLFKDQEDEKYMELISRLKPVERYAVNFLTVECMPDPVSEESEEVEEEPSREPTPEPDEDIYPYGNVLDELETFPDVNPPCPCPAWYPSGPSEEGDIYYDVCLDDRYEPQFMDDARLPTKIHDFYSKSIPVPPKEVRPPLPAPVFAEPTLKQTKRKSDLKGRAKSAAVLKSKSKFHDDDAPVPKKKVRKSTEKPLESPLDESPQLSKIRKQDSERQKHNLNPIVMTAPKKPIFPFHLYKKPETDKTSAEPFVMPRLPSQHGPKTNIPKLKKSLSPLDDILPEKF